MMGSGYVWIATITFGMMFKRIIRTSYGMIFKNVNNTKVMKKKKNLSFNVLKCNFLLSLVAALK